MGITDDRLEEIIQFQGRSLRKVEDIMKRYGKNTALADLTESMTKSLITDCIEALHELSELRKLKYLIDT